MRNMLIALGKSLARCNGQGYADQFDHTMYVHLGHDFAAMKLNRLVTQPQLGPDNFVVFATDHQPKNFTFTRR